MARPNGLTLSLAGQSLLEFEPTPEALEGLEPLKSIIAADVSFTNLEVTVPGRRGGWPMKDLAWCTRPEPGSIDILSRMGFSVASLANNHSWDLGPTGVLDTIDAMESIGLAHVGTGATLEEAEAPVILDTPRGRVGIIAMASGNLAPAAFATATAACGARARPGVNPVKVQDVHKLPRDVFEQLSTCAAKLGVRADADGFLQFEGATFASGGGAALTRRIEPADERRHLEIIARTRADVDVLMVYLHQHHWEPEWQEVGPWLQHFARQCIDAGADLFIGHGVPMLQALEVYRGRLIGYSLGNFIFHPTAGGATWPDRRCWHSAIVRLKKQDDRDWECTFHPIVLGSGRAIEEDIWDDASRRFPRLATPREAENVLDEIDRLSAPFGVKLERKNGVGILRLSRAE